MKKFLQNILSFFARLFGNGEPGGPQDASEIQDGFLEVEMPEDGGVDVELPDIGDEEVVDSVTVEVPVAATAQRYLWCIDHGHGEATAGKRSPVLEDGRQFFEYRFNRVISGEVMERLEQRGIAFFNVTPEVEGDVSLTTRVNRANAEASDLPKIFLSIHANASTNGAWETRDVRGTETWFYGNSDAGKRIASTFQRRIIRKIQFRDRGIRYHEPVSKSFFVLRKTLMPAVLLECGFYTQQEECLRLLDPDTQKRLASALVEAIVEIEANGYEGQSFHPKVVKIVKT